MASSALSIDLGLRIREFQERFFPTLPPGVAEVLGRSIEELVRSGIASRAIREGDAAPEFQLRNQGGEHISLANLLARGPAVVTFYRGEW